MMNPYDPRRHLVCVDCAHTWDVHTWKGFCQGRMSDGGDCPCRTSKGQSRRFIEPVPQR